MAANCTEKTKWVYFDGENGSSTPFIFGALRKFQFFPISIFWKWARPSSGPFARLLVLKQSSGSVQRVNLRAREHADSQNIWIHPRIQTAVPSADPVWQCKSVGFTCVSFLINYSSLTRDAATCVGAAIPTCTLTPVDNTILNIFPTRKETSREESGTSHEQG